MAKKTFTEKMLFSGDLPKVEDVSEHPRLLQRFGGPKLYIAAPMQYHDLMAKVPEGKLVTADRLRAYLALKAGTNATCPLTAGMFINICAHAGLEDPAYRIPYWRTLKAGGELNEKYPEGIDGQRFRLEAEGHSTAQRGKQYFVSGYEESLWDICE